MDIVPETKLFGAQEADTANEAVPKKRDAVMTDAEIFPTTSKVFTAVTPPIVTLTALDPVPPITAVLLLDTVAPYPRAIELTTPDPLTLSANAPRKTLLEADRELKPA